MPRPRKVTPSYLLHKATGRGRAVWTDAAGIPHQRLLPGAYNSKESREAFDRLKFEVSASPLQSPEAKRSGITVNELLLAYQVHAEQHYRGPDGRQTDEVRQLKTVIRPVRELYGPTLAATFGPLALKAIRTRFVALGWGRKTINARVERIRRAFRWAVGEELIHVATYQALAAVDGLRLGRTSARESEPVGPVDDALVDATLPTSLGTSAASSSSNA